MHVSEALRDPRRKFFDDLAASWHDTFEAKPETEELLRLVNPQPGQCFLDVGCGTGYFAKAIRRAVDGQATVCAVDISMRMLRESRRRGKGVAIRLCQADAHRLPYRDGTFDCVTMVAVFAHLRDKPLALSEAGRVLKVGGTLLIAHPLGKEALAQVHSKAGGPIGHDFLPEESQLAEWLSSCGLSILRYTDDPDLYVVLARRENLPQGVPKTSGALHP